MSGPIVEPVHHRPALPARLVDAASATFVGRQAELNQLGACGRLAERGERQIVLIAGDSGIGKTTLAARVAVVAYEQGATVLLGRCEANSLVPYEPFVGALTTYMATAPDDALAIHLAGFGGDLVRLVPELAARVPAADTAARLGDPEVERHATFRAVVGVLASLAEVAPVILVLDDLHWADGATLRLLRALGSMVQSERLLVLGTYRGSEIDAAHPLQSALESLSRYAGITRLALTGLADDEVRDLVANLLDGEVGPPPSMVQSLARNTGGNPFFVREIVRNLQESEQSTVDDSEVDGDHVATAGAPQSVRDVIERRVTRLGPEAGDMLSVASLMGREFTLSLLGPMTGLDVPQLLDLLERAVRASLVTESVTDLDTFAFAHAIVQQSIYQQMSLPKRRRLHRDVARLLEVQAKGDGVTSADIAHHWMLSDTPVEALPWARAAAQIAMSMVAPDVSLRWLEAALTLHAQHLSGDLVLRCDLLTEFGVAQKLAGEAAHRETLLEATDLADQLDDPLRMARAALANFRGFFTAVGRVDVEKVAALEKTIARYPAGDAADLSELLAIYANETTFSHTVERRRQLADEALAMAERSGDQFTVLRVLNHLFAPLLVPEFLEERLEKSDRAVELAKQVGEVIYIFTSLIYRMRTCFEAGRLSEARTILDELGQTAESLAHPFPKWIVWFTEATWALLVGDPDGAERWATETLEVGMECGQPDAFAIYVACLHSVRWQQGRLAEVVNVIAQAIADAPDIPGYRAALARAQLDVGAEGEARAILEEALADGFENLPKDLAWTTALVVYGEVAVRLNHVVAAKSILNLLAPWTNRMAYIAAAIDGPVATTAASLALTLGRRQDAEGWFAQGEAMCAAPEQTFFLWHNRIEWSRLLLSSEQPRERARGAAWLTEASAVATERGYLGLARRVASLRAEIEGTPAT